MSAKPKSGNVVVSGRPAGRVGIRGRLALLIGGGLLLLALIGGATFLVVRHFQGANKNAAPAQPKGTKTGLTTQQTASEQAHKGDVDQAFATYETAIKNAKAPAEKATLYQQEMNTAIAQKKYDTAITAGQELIKISKTSTAYGLLAVSYEDKGDKATALKYYKMAVAAYANSGGTHNSNAGVNEYRAKVNELSKEAP